MTKEIAQEMIDKLIKIKKLYEDMPPDEFPPQGRTDQHDLKSSDGRYHFLLTINRRNNSVSGKCSYQTRLENDTPLVRLDINSTGRHINPDGEEIYGHHIHFLKEGYRDSFATNLSNYYPIDNQKDLTIDELVKIFEKFCLICNIEESKIRHIPLN